jgi:hypothetical protein
MRFDGYDLVHNCEVIEEQMGGRREGLLLPKAKFMVGRNGEDRCLRFHVCGRGLLMWRRYVIKAAYSTKTRFDPIL